MMEMFHLVYYLIIVPCLAPQVGKDTWRGYDTGEGKPRVRCGETKARVRQESGEEKVRRGEGKVKIKV